MIGIKRPAVGSRASKPSRIIAASYFKPGPKRCILPALDSNSPKQSDSWHQTIVAQMKKQNNPEISYSPTTAISAQLRLVQHPKRPKDPGYSNHMRKGILPTLDQAEVTQMGGCESTRRRAIGP